ncbi:O-antigen ligase family protein [Clostridium perfringens]|nr:O-antigen ligase family protein [Clostridium perfringens]
MKKILTSTDYLIFLNMLLIGSDIFSFRILGSTIRVVQFLLLLTSFFLVLKNKYRVTNVFSMILFIIVNMISTMISYDKMSSLLYVLWTIFNYLFVFCLFYSWARERENEFIYNLWRKTFLLQGFFIIIQFALELVGIKILNSQNYFGIPRPALWFYEPSYLATYFIIFFVISFYMFINTEEKIYRNDTILSIIFLVFITSSTGFIGIFIGFLICILFTKQKILKKSKNIFKAVIIIIICSIVTYKLYPKIFDVFIGRLFNEGLIISSGNRMIGWKEAFNVFKENMLFGVGPDSYQTYTGSLIPPTNVTLEMLSYIGLIGLITFIIFIVSVIRTSFKKSRKIDINNLMFSKAIFISFLVFLIVLQFNQNYLRLYMWMQLGIIAGLNNFKRKEEINE